MPSTVAVQLRTDLLGGTYNSSSFQTALANPSIFAAFTELANNYGSSEMLANSTNAFPLILQTTAARTIASNSPSFLRACANSGYATEQLVTTSNGAVLFGLILRDTTGTKFKHWRNSRNNYTFLKSFINATNSKLKRQIFTSTTPSTWTPPGSLQAMSIFGVGGGSEAGGEVRCLNVPFTSLPSSGQLVTVGLGYDRSPLTSATDTTIGSLFVAVDGDDGGSGPTSVAGGVTTNGGYLSFTDWRNPLTAAFQCTNASQKGGSLGQDGLPGSRGQDGLPGTGGRGGRAYGGGGGYANAASFASESGYDAEPNTGGGGGGGAGSGSLGNGGSGIVVIYWLEG